MTEDGDPAGADEPTLGRAFECVERRAIDTLRSLGRDALGTATYLAWRRGLPLVQIPTVTSVDAGFTDAIGIRVDGELISVADLTDIDRAAADAAYECTLGLPRA